MLWIALASLTTRACESAAATITVCGSKRASNDEAYAIARPSSKLNGKCARKRPSGVSAAVANGDAMAEGASDADAADEDLDDFDLDFGSLSKDGRTNGTASAAAAAVAADAAAVVVAVELTSAPASTSSTTAA